MEKLKFDSGEKSWKVGGGVLRFNPCDPALYSRFLEVLEELEQLAPEETLAKTEEAVRSRLRRVFPGADLEAMFPGSLLALCGNGKLLLVNFLEALEPVLLDGARRYAETVE